MDGTDERKSTIELPTEMSCPNILDEDLILHIDVNYGLTVTKVEKLNGYYDSNFHIKVDREHSNPYIKEIAQDGYIVKVSSVIDTENPETLYAQQRVMSHLRRKGIPVQSSVKSVLDEELTEIRVLDKKGSYVSHKVSLRSFLPGDVIASFTLTPEVLVDTGTFIAQVSQALEDFYHPFYDDFEVLWSMNNTPRVAEAVHAVREDCRRTICNDVLKAFNDEVVPLMKHFRKGFIHGDLNEGNILARDRNGRLEICGLLDFQHSAFSHPIYDLAICAAYMMMCPYSKVPRPLIPGYILAGYVSVITINEAEDEAFYTLVASRMVMSLVYGAYSHSLNPTNDYILQTSICGWDALKSYTDLPKEQLKSAWKKIVDSSENKMK